MKIKKALLITLVVALLVPVSAISAFAGMGEMNMGNQPSDQASSGTATVTVSADVTKAVDKLLATLSQVLDQAKALGEKNPEEAAKLLNKALQIQEQASALLQKAAQAQPAGGNKNQASSGGMQMGGGNPGAGMEPEDQNEMAMEMAMEGHM